MAKKKRIFKISPANRCVLAVWKKNFKKPLASRTVEQYYWYLREIAEFLGKKSLLKVQLQPLEAYVNSRELGDSARTGIWSAIKRFCRWAIRFGLVPEERFREIIDFPVSYPKKEVKPHIPISKVPHVLEAARTVRQKLVCSLIFGCGLRRGEVAKLRWTNVSLNEEWLIIPAMIAKRGHGRGIPIPVWVADVFKSYTEVLNPDEDWEMLHMKADLAEMKLKKAREGGEPLPPEVTAELMADLLVHSQFVEPADPVFPSNYKVLGPPKPISDKRVYHMFREACILGGVDESIAHPNSGRHTYAIWLLNKTNIATVSTNMGHRSIETTARYLGVSDVERGRQTRKAMSALPGGELPV